MPEDNKKNEVTPVEDDRTDEENIKTLPPPASAVEQSAEEHGAEEQSAVMEQIGVNIGQIGNVLIYDGTPEAPAVDGQSAPIEIIPESQQGTPALPDDEKKASDAPDSSDAPATPPSCEPAETTKSDPEPRPSSPPISYRPLTTDRPPSMDDIREALRYFKISRKDH